MAFELDDAMLLVNEDLRNELRSEWERLAHPGTWFDGAQRVAIAREARAAFAGGSANSSLPEVVIEVAQSVAVAAPFITRQWVEDTLERGLSIEQYVEIVGLVSRLPAVDAYTVAVDAKQEALPSPEPGEPTRKRNPAARPRAAFVPTAYNDLAPNALTAVPHEADAMMRFDAIFYLGPEQRDDPYYENALTKCQIEFLAACTSYCNRCFY